MMDFPLPIADIRRRPAATWFLVALAGLLLGAASLASVLTPDARDYAARPATSQGISAL